MLIVSCSYKILCGVICKEYFNCIRCRMLKLDVYLFVICNCIHFPTVRSFINSFLSIRRRDRGSFWCAEAEGAWIDSRYCFSI